VTARRLAALTGVAIAVAAIGGVSLPYSRRAVVAARPAVSASVVQAAAAPVALGVGAPSSDLHGLPPGILGRAAAARALELAPAPACVPAARPEADACASGRDSVEIQWDVAQGR
jgi:hypothetical protein